jgi:gamma-glutamyltranspeptidase / glutathione hydrolase
MTTSRINSPRISSQLSALSSKGARSTAESLELRAVALIIALLVVIPVHAQRAPKTQKPPLHGRHWMAITGKPLAATAGSMMFQKGGNAVDAAAAMIAACSTMWDTLSWGGETQALIYNPHTNKVIGLNALGWAPTGATVDYYRSKGIMDRPPEYGPLSAVTPGTPGGIMYMLAEYGTLSLKDILAPSIQMADGYAIETELANTIERQKNWIKKWPYSKADLLPHINGAATTTTTTSFATQGAASSSPVPEQDRPSTAPITGPREGPEPGEVFKQPDLAATLRKLVDAEQQALAAGKSRKEAIYAAFDRFYKGDIAQEIARSTQEQGGLITTQDLAQWKPHFEEPVKTNYKGIDVYKLTVWTQGPAMLQALNILENFDLKSMGFNSPQYINTVYQAMSLAFADRDFYYGDPAVPPDEPVLGLLSKDYARERAKLINPDHNVADIGPGDPYPYQRSKNPFVDLLKDWGKTLRTASSSAELEQFQRAFLAGTTSVEAADEEGWVVSVTPSGGWTPAVIAGHTGIGLSQRMQSFVFNREENPFNVMEPHKQPRVTLTPTLAFKDGKPFLCFSVQGGDTQDQNLLQLFLNVVEFGMPIQNATEAPNFNSSQMRASLAGFKPQAGEILLSNSTSQDVRAALEKMGYHMKFGDRTSGPLNAIEFDQKHGTMWGGSSNNGEDYGIAW